MGKVLKPKGLDGTFKCGFAKNDASEVSAIKKIFVGGREFKVLRAYGSGEFAFFKVEGVDCIEAAQALVGSNVELAREDAAPLDDGEYYLSDFAGCTVFDDSRRKIGVITGSDNFGASEIFEIATTGGQVLVPFVPGLVVNLNIAKKEVIFSKKTLEEVTDEI